MNNWFVYIILCIGITVFDQSSHVAGSQVLRLRGVSSKNKSLYPSEKDFECFDGSLIIPFSHINDDYCDCADGTDEPGTAACPRGKFYCENIGHESTSIPSGRVNDGFCDCCDGSDEYTSKIQCPNICHDLGKEARLEAQKVAALLKEGNQIREKMRTQGKQMKSEFQIRLVKLRADYEEAELSKNEKEILKKQAEERESLALEKYKTTEPEESSKDKEDNQTEAEDYFKMLDSDSSGTLVVGELQTKVIFDKNRDGIVSEEEAMFFLNNQKELSLQEFIETAWPIVKPFVMLEQGMFKPAQSEEEKVEETVSEVIENPPKEDKEDVPQEEEEEEATESKDHEEKQEAPPVQYDEETQSLIDEANSARERFQEAEKAVNDLLTEIRTLENKLNQDYGPEDEFAPLDGECFEHTNLEYIYTLCMFGKATQRSKSGGNDINLGHWHEWVGPRNRKYFRMKYDRGLTCWNGPARTTIVNLSCGKENKLLSVTEPNRCEYKMEFTTPALCNPNLDTTSTVEEDSHDEL